MTLVPHAVVSHIIVDKQTGKANGMHYVDALTRNHREVFGKVVLVP